MRHITLPSRSLIKLKTAEARWTPHSALKASAIDQDVLVLKKAQGILNKLSTRNFDRLSKQLLDTGLTSEARIKAVTSMVFQKALDEEFFSSMYANLCKQLMDLAGGPSATRKSAFNTDLLSECQREFARVTSDERESPLAGTEGLSAGDAELLRVKRKRHLLG